MDIEVGANVVVPGCGVGEIMAIETMDLGEGDQAMVRIALGEREDGRMWVPVDRLVAEGIRSVMPKDRVKETWKAIEETVAPKKRDNWNRRQRRYNEQLMSNEPKQMGELLGELASVRREKPLSFGERRLFEKVEALLIDELAAAMGKEREVVEKKMAKLIGAT